MGAAISNQVAEVGAGGTEIAHFLAYMWELQATLRGFGNLEMASARTARVCGMGRPASAALEGDG